MLDEEPGGIPRKDAAESERMALWMAAESGAVTFPPAAAALATAAAFTRTPR